MNLHRVLVAALALAACGGDDDGDGAGGVDGGDADAGVPTSSTCDGPAAARTVVVIVNGDTDFVQILALADGALSTDGPMFTLDNPRGVAMRDDGLEALVAYGGFGDPVGVAVFSIEPGGAGGDMVDSIDLGAGQTPWAIAYASDDRAVVVTAGPDIGTIVPIDRGAGGFTVGDETEIPDNWPLDLSSRPGHEEVVMLRANLAEDEASDVSRLAHGGSAWTTSGTVGAIGPPTVDLAVHGGGDLVYGSTSDPDDSVATDNLDARGVLHVLGIGDGGVEDGSTHVLPGLSSFVALDAHDRFLVLPTAIYQVDGETNTPIIRQYRLVTVPLDAGGAPGEPLDLAEPFDALLTYDLDVAPSGHLVHALEMYTGSVPAGEESPVVVWAQPTAGAWEECQRVHLGGAVELAIAPR